MKKAYSIDDKYIFWLIIVFIVYMNFEGFIKLRFDYHPIAHGFKFVFALLFLFIWLFITGTPKTKLNKPLFLFCALLMIQFLNPISGFSISSFKTSFLGMLYYIAFVPLFFVSYRVINLKRVNIILFLIVGLATLSALTAHWQFSEIDNYHYYEFYTQKMGYDKSTLENIQNFMLHGPLAFDNKPPRYWYSTGILISLFFFIKTKSKKMSLVYILLGFNLSVALLLSGYRFAIGATILALGLIIFLGVKFTEKNKKIASLAKISFLLLFFSIPFISFLPKYNLDRYEGLLNPLEEYSSQRGYTWWEAAKEIIRFPFGQGLSADRKDNYIYAVAAHAGLLVVLAIFWIYILLFKQLWANKNRLKKTKMLNITIFVILFSFMFEVSFLAGEGPSYWMFWVFSGVLFNLVNLEKKMPEHGGYPIKFMQESGLLSNSSFINNLFSNLNKNKKYKPSANNLEPVNKSFIASQFNRYYIPIKCKLESYINESQSVKLLKK